MPLKPYQYHAIILDVYDGNTFTVTINLGLYIKWEKQTVRLARVNTPEVRGEEREEGIKVRDCPGCVFLSIG